MESTLVTHLSGWGNYTRIHYADGKEKVVCLTLKRALDKTPFSHFIRIHRKTAVNPFYVTRIRWPANVQAGSARCFIKGSALPGGQYLTVSRRRIAVVRRQFDQYQHITDGHS
ncbi:LytTR family DNA-binding domain-containing protein [Larkinella sp. C7]|uniref:LytTR family DNA-binding domain-containing protein n=1 Tax=Larkinella sp. C7 TaxID=2576607 RepID=UPI0011111773|nr:LytTR family DNA-binding domain-containing protein [Larkinella sp. C7]